MQRFETIVLGLGALGSAATYQLAKRGHRVLGLDRYAPPHVHGSSHGDTRITRLGIGEGTEYTPLALRSHELWRQIERETGKELLNACGGLIISSSGEVGHSRVKGFFNNTVAAAERYGIAYELLDADAIKRRFPQFNVGPEEFAYYEKDAGFLRVEDCVAANLLLARKHGAAIHTGETVEKFDVAASGVAVVTDKDTYTADHLLIAAGSWTPKFLPAGYAETFSVTRQVLYWFEIARDQESFAPGRFPIFIWELKDRTQGVYGFPAIDGPAGGLKVATEQREETSDPDAVDRTVTEADMRAMYRDYVAPYLPAVAPRCLRTATCLYTVTPGARFVLDRHPESERVVVGSACSGHGFKHSAALGEALSQWIIDGESKIDLSPFSFSALREREAQAHQPSPAAERRRAGSR
jgi:sarcosine oxidase